MSKLEFFLFGQDNYKLYKWIRLDENHKALHFNKPLEDRKEYTMNNNWKANLYLDMRLVASSNRYNNKSNITNNYIDDKETNRGQEVGINLTTFSTKSLWNTDKKTDRLQASLLAVDDNGGGENIITI